MGVWVYIGHVGYQSFGPNRSPRLQQCAVEQNGLNILLNLG